MAAPSTRNIVPLLPTSTTTIPSFVASLARGRRPPAGLRRGRRFEPPWAATPPVNPPFAPEIIRRRRVACPVARHSRAMVPPVAASQPIPVLRCGRTKLAPPRRGQRFEGYQTQAQPPRAAVKARRTSAPPPRRGRILIVPPAVVTPPPVWPPPAVRARRKPSVTPRRGHLSWPIPTTVTVTPAVWPPSAIRARIKAARLPRRARTLFVVPTQTPAVAPPWPPQVVRRRQKLPIRWRRGRRADPAWLTSAIAGRVPDMRSDDLATLSLRSVDLARVTVDGSHAATLRLESADQEV